MALQLHRNGSLFHYRMNLRQDHCHRTGIGRLVIPEKPTGHPGVTFH